MNHTLLSGLLGFALLAGFLSGCQQEQAQQTQESPTSAATTELSVPSAAAKEKAVAAKDALFQRLSGRLIEVMQTEGPAAAIAVCSREAATFAREVGREQGLEIGRTSLKLRNLANRPPHWVQPLLRKPPTEPKFVSLEDGHTGALFPIRLGEKCLTCHGLEEQLPEEVKSQLAALYPVDQAIGYREGDLRGWFWVDVP